jgi:hypothetical protein
MQLRRGQQHRAGPPALPPWGGGELWRTVLAPVGQGRAYWLSLLMASVLCISSCQPTFHPLQQGAAGYRLDDPTVASTPFTRVQWKAILLAGDDSISAFDVAIEDLARLFQQHHIDVVQRFTADRSRVSETVRLATEANLRNALSAMHIQPGEGCIVYATSHGTVHGLRLTHDRASGHYLSPIRLQSMVRAACGDAPTVLVLSGCYTGTYLRDETVGPHIIMLTAAAANRTSFGCRAEARYTYYDGCFLQAFAKAPTWQALHRAVSYCIATAEQSQHNPPSTPQAFFGRLMKDVPIPRS